MTQKNKRTFTHLLISKTFYVFLFACLALVIYGIYVYVQDSAPPSTPALTVIEENSGSIPENQKQESEFPEIVENFQNLDKQIELQVKTDLMKEELMQAGELAPTLSSPMSMNISFSNYNSAQETFSVGVIVVNDQTMRISNCSLIIQANPDQTASQTTDIIGQRGASGCRFTDIVLDNLPAPTPSIPWIVSIHGNDVTNNRLIALERNIVSMNDLGNLINN